MSAMTELEQETRLAGGLSTLPRVNLLPPEIAEQAHFKKVQAGLVGALVLAVAGVGFLYVGATGSVSEAQTSLETSQASGALLQTQVDTYASVTETYAKAAAAQAMLEEAMGQEVRYSRFLNDLSLTIPDNVWLQNATFTQAEPAAAAADPATAGSLGTVTFSGVAFTQDDVAVWLEKLATQDGFANPYLSSATGALIGERPTVDWSSTVVLTESALSNRYTETGS